MKTFTADNGTEFHEYSGIERATGVTFYFATPYHYWERGSNETPTASSVTSSPRAPAQHCCNASARLLNGRPRERLGFKPSGVLR